jgi:hypothetical protein
LALSIGWILVVTGTITAVGGLAALLFPRWLLLAGFGIPSVDDSMMFFVRHWGVLIFIVGALVVYGAYQPAVRAPVLTGAALEKFFVGGLIFSAPVKPTAVMTIAAVSDGVFALLYVAYLAGL